MPLNIDASNPQQTIPFAKNFLSLIISAKAFAFIDYAGLQLLRKKTPALKHRKIAPSISLSSNSDLTKKAWPCIRRRSTPGMKNLKKIPLTSCSNYK
jgi:hypothetical protein